MTDQTPTLRFDRHRSDRRPADSLTREPRCGHAADTSPPTTKFRCHSGRELPLPAGAPLGILAVEDEVAGSQRLDDTHQRDAEVVTRTQHQISFGNLLGEVCQALDAVEPSQVDSISILEIEDRVVTRAIAPALEDEDIFTGTATEHVVTGVASQPVVTGTAIQDVIAFCTPQFVFAACAVYGVVTAAPPKPVVAAVAREDIVVVGAGEFLDRGKGVTLGMTAAACARRKFTVTPVSDHQ